MRHIDPPGYRHEALFYRGDEEFLAGTVPLVRDSVDADAAVLVAVPRPRARALREALGPDGDSVAFAEMEELGRNPGRIIGAWREFIREHAGGDVPPLGIGEPIWPERTEAELVECQRHETLLNLAFTPETPWTLLCPYDADRLAPEVLAGARRLLRAAPARRRHPSRPHHLGRDLRLDPPAHQRHRLRLAARVRRPFRRGHAVPVRICERSVRRPVRGLWVCHTRRNLGTANAPHRLAGVPARGALLPG